MVTAAILKPDISHVRRLHGQDIMADGERTRHRNLAFRDKEPEDHGNPSKRRGSHDGQRLTELEIARKRSEANKIDQKVLEYLNKKGYSRTEAMLRRESATQDSEGRPILIRAEEIGGAQYARAFGQSLSQ